MKLQIGIRSILFIMILVIGSFDRHLLNYFPVEVKAMIQSDAIPVHSDLPVKSCDYHEDITLKTCFCIIPAPLEVSVHNYRNLNIPISFVTTHSVWQPPETNASTFRHSIIATILFS